LANPYAPAPSPPSKEAPVIRDSLKRKFQPPNKRTSAAPAPTKGSVQSQKPSDKRPAKPEEEEDELPEELKRFGKDLVEKIENEIMDGGDPITFDDIAGLEDAKQTIQEVICWPMKRPDLFTGLRKAPNGLLLYGPPGTGKTLIGKAIAHESGATFFSISSSSLTSKWIGEGEKLVRTMFAVAAYREPSVVFIDEIDSLLTQRKSDENEASRRIKTEFLVQLDGTGTTAQGRVLTIGATNRPQELDEAARRRFVKRLYIPLPVEPDRASLLQKLLGTNNHRLTAADVQKLAKETAGYSGADLKALCTDAAMGPIRQLGPQALEVNASDVPPISSRHFRHSLRSMNPSVAPADLVQYEKWDNIYGSKRVDESLDGDDDSSEGEE
jgi:SpoVK/Ycf46/Vps4 family AAA+-type ATPase